MITNYRNLKQNLLEVCLWIDESLSTKTNFNRETTSYGLKHVYEKDTGNYITNESFVYCMLICGFKTKKVDMSSPNFYFNFNFTHEYLKGKKNV